MTAAAVRNLPARGRIDALQVVRAFAFLGVFLFHAAKPYSGDGAVYNFLATSPGRWSVSVFFLLSGFLMTYSYWDRTPDHSFKGSAVFAWKKIRRLYPLHLIMLLAGAVYLYINGESISEIAGKLAITVPLVHTLFPSGYQAINSVAWYLSVCVFLYFCFPFILKCVKKCRSMTRAVAVIAAVFLIQLLAGWCFFRFTDLDIKWITYCHPLFRLGDFVIGCLVAYIYNNRRTLKPAVWKCTVMEAAAILLNIGVSVYYTLAPEENSWFTYTSLFIQTSILLIYSFALDNGVISKLLKNRAVLWIAAISPYSFLIHRLVIHYINLFVKEVLHYERISFFLVVAVAFAVTVLAVYVYMFFEKKAGKRRSTRETL